MIRARVYDVREEKKVEVEVAASELHKKSKEWEVRKPVCIIPSKAHALQTNAKKANVRSDWCVDWMAIAEFAPTLSTCIVICSDDGTGQASKPSAATQYARKMRVI